MNQLILQSVFDKGRVGIGWEEGAPRFTINSVNQHLTIRVQEMVTRARVQGLCKEEGGEQGCRKLVKLRLTRV